MSSIFIKADEMAKQLGVSKPYAYKLVQKLNAELKNVNAGIFLTQNAGREWPTSPVT